MSTKSKKKPKTQFLITHVGPSRIDFQIGNHTPKGYSCVHEHGIQHGYVSRGRINEHNLDLKVWVFEYEALPWRGVITDQELIRQMEKCNKGYWIPSLIKSALRLAAEADTLLFMVQRTLQMVEASARLKGRTEQAQAIVGALGLDKRLVEFNDS